MLELLSPAAQLAERNFEAASAPARSPLKLKTKPRPSCRFHADGLRHPPASATLGHLSFSVPISALIEFASPLAIPQHRPNCRGCCNAVVPLRGRRVAVSGEPNAYTSFLRHSTNLNSFPTLHRSPLPTPHPRPPSSPPFFHPVGSPRIHHGKCGRRLWHRQPWSTIPPQLARPLRRHPGLREGLPPLGRERRPSALVARALLVCLQAHHVHAGCGVEVEGEERPVSFDGKNGTREVPRDETRADGGGLPRGGRALNVPATTAIFSANRPPVVTFIPGKDSQPRRRGRHFHGRPRARLRGALRRLRRNHSLDSRRVSRPLRPLVSRYHPSSILGPRLAPILPPLLHHPLLYPLTPPILDPGTPTFKLVFSLTTFALSAALHAFGMFAMARTGSGAAIFFLLQPLGIGIEIAALGIAKKIGVGKEGGWGWRGVGMVWTAVWLLATCASFFDELVQAGKWTVEAAPPSIRIFCRARRNP